MAKPKIFLSSTCYDLNDARATLTPFLEGFGFEVLNSQLPDFGVTPKMHSSRACLEQVEDADYLVLIIGARHGSDIPNADYSITNAEFNRAKELGLLINTFVKSDVQHARPLFHANPTGDFSRVVDDVRIFKFIDSIASDETDNWLREYDSVEDIKATLKAQFGHYLKLYAKYLGRVGNKVFKPITMAGSLNGMPSVCEVLGTEPTLLDSTKHK